jgi:hypothetical protein
MNLEGQLRAYGAAANAVDVIATRVLEKVPEKRVVVASESQLLALNQYRSFLVQMAQLKTMTQFVIDLAPPPLEPPSACVGGPIRPAGPGVAVAFAAINSLLGAAALFKSDVTLTGKAVTLDEFAMTTLLLRSLQEKKVEVIYPAAYYFLPSAGDGGAAMRAFNEVLALKTGLRNKAFAHTSVYEALAARFPNPNAECKAALATLKGGLDRYVAGLAAAEKSIDDVGATLTKQDAQSGLTLLSAYRASERVDTQITGANAAPLLQVKVIAAGGSTQTRKNLFSTQIAYGGGSILAYHLFSQEGTLLAADTVSWYAGAVDAEEFAPGPVAIGSPPSSAGGTPRPSGPR